MIFLIFPKFQGKFYGPPGRIGGEHVFLQFDPVRIGRFFGGSRPPGTLFWPGGRALTVDETGARAPGFPAWPGGLDLPVLHRFFYSDIWLC